MVWISDKHLVAKREPRLVRRTSRHRVLDTSSSCSVSPPLFDSSPSNVSSLRTTKEFGWWFVFLSRAIEFFAQITTRFLRADIPEKSAPAMLCQLVLDRSKIIPNMNPKTVPNIKNKCCICHSWSVVLLSARNFGSKIAGQWKRKQYVHGCPIKQFPRPLCTAKLCTSSSVAWNGIILMVAAGQRPFLVHCSR